MNHITQSESKQEDIFILDRDLPNQRPSTPPPNYNLINQTRNSIYEIVKTEDQHVVLVHERTPINTTNEKKTN